MNEFKIIDFHTHTFFSDGVLSPAEHVRRAFVNGYNIVGLTDHVDFSNLEFVYQRLFTFAQSMKEISWDIRIIPGIEITHVPVNKIENIVLKAKDLKIPLIIFHGESPVEPVEKGSNRAAIECGVDILAHPGLILAEDMKKAAELKVNIEITARRGHSITNGHVAKLAAKYNTPLVVDTDAHEPRDFFTTQFRETVIKGCGMDNPQIEQTEKNIRELATIICNRIG